MKRASKGTHSLCVTVTLVSLSGIYVVDSCGKKLEKHYLQRQDNDPLPVRAVASFTSKLSSSKSLRLVSRPVNVGGTASHVAKWDSAFDEERGIAISRERSSMKKVSIVKSSTISLMVALQKESTNDITKGSSIISTPTLDLGPELINVDVGFSAGGETKNFGVASFWVSGHNFEGTKLMDLPIRRSNASQITKSNSRALEKSKILLPFIKFIRFCKGKRKSKNISILSDGRLRILLTVKLRDP